MQRPLPEEHKPYFRHYIALVPEGNYTEVLKENTDNTVRFFKEIAPAKHNYRYTDGKWTIKEILLHMMDTERIFSFRTLAAARGDSRTPLPYMDENLYAAGTDVSERTMEDMLEEFIAIRTATRKLFENMTDSQTKLTANAAGQDTSARAFGYMIIGHVIHHTQVIKERYL
jgi:uncharacterized damage-inducible protein DinB